MDTAEGQIVADAVAVMVVLIVMVGVPSSMVEPAGMRTVPLPVEQQLHAA